MSYLHYFSIMQLNGHQVALMNVEKKSKDVSNKDDDK